MKYYKSNNKLVKYNPKLDKWFWCNKLGDKLIDKPFVLESIKPNLFNQLLNEWYRTIKHEWIYQGIAYRKDLCFKDNQELYNTLPSHKLYHSDDCKIVYHKGTLYYACIFHLYPNLVLFDFKTKEWCRRSNLNGCFAVMNLETKEYI